jgi:hypothetical protein
MKRSIVDYFSKSSSGVSTTEDGPCGSKKREADNGPSTSYTNSSTGTGIVEDKSQSCEVIPCYLDSQNISNYPVCWNDSTWREFKTKYEWLVCREGKLGCSVCKDVQNIGVSKSQGVYISKEWSSISVGPVCGSKQAQLTSLREKKS